MQNSPLIATISKGLTPLLKKMASFLAFQMYQEITATLLRKVTASFEPKLSNTSEDHRKADTGLPLSPFKQMLHPNQTALVHGQTKSRCSIDSIASSHNGHLLELAHLLLYRFSLVATAFLQTLHQKLRILPGTFNFQISFQNPSLGLKEGSGLLSFLSSRSLH